MAFRGSLTEAGVPQDAAKSSRRAGEGIQQLREGVERAAERVLLTPRHDDSWCHTVAYTSALAAGAALAGRLGPFTAQPAAARELLERAIRFTAPAPIAGRLADRRVVLCAGADPDHTTARELALKIAEGARLPTIALELETVLHGQLAAHEPADALILVAITDQPERERLTRRAAHAARQPVHVDCTGFRRQHRRRAY